MPLNIFEAEDEHHQLADILYIYRKHKQIYCKKVTEIVFSSFLLVTDLL